MMDVYEWFNIRCLIFAAFSAKVQSVNRYD